ncbi:hypothetical protein H3146_05895 [Streptomyces sp. OF3]|uniref:Uncharacterized protein n=1 Tax=Streptomyces alkaliterrae TaxID=2213162 RepID=A0A7W3WIF0_9ACTN|nr:hypothetical protein [Streptomyces alkaliterrae]MBB1252899.1 hypothetical protein [Streptomyces alkaliterrae]
MPDQTTTEHTRPASTPTRTPERPARPRAGTETPGASTDRQAGAESRQRYTADTITDDALDALYDRLDGAEAERDRARRIAVALECETARLTDQLAAWRALLAEAGDWAPHGIARRIDAALDTTEGQ